MAAFNPFQLLLPVAEAAIQAQLPPPQTAPSQPTAAQLAQAQAAQAQVAARLQAAEAAEALTAAQTAGREQALIQQQQLAEAAAQAQAQAAEGGVAADTAAAIAARQGALRRDTSSQRARLSAAGVTGGRSFRALLNGLHKEADAETASRQEDARLRIEAIRQGVEVKRKTNLLDLAEERRRGQLSRHAARVDTIAARHALDLQRHKIRTSGLADALYGAGGGLSLR